MQYDDIPDAARFRKDSSVSFAVRSKDPVLTRIDGMLEEYQRNRHTLALQEQLVALAILVDLHLATRYWIRLATTQPQHATLEHKRKPAIEALQAAVTKRLAQEFVCSVDAVQQRVTDFTCREMSEHGKSVDASPATLDKHLPEKQQKPPAAYYFKTARRAVAALRFKNGVAYRMSEKPGKKGKLVRLNSADYYTPVPRAGTFTREGWAPFAMGPEGDIYMTRHYRDEHEPGNATGERVFHSTYTGGSELIAAGTMLVVDGIVLALCADSGHYKPLDFNVAEALRVLALRGVKIGRIMVHDWRGTAKPQPAFEFIANQRSEFMLHASSQLPANWSQKFAPPAAPAPTVAAVHLARVSDDSINYQN